MSHVRRFAVAAVVCVFAGRGAVAAEHEVGFFDAKGVKIRYVVQGEGEPVVLVHGLLASAATNWQLPGVTAALAKGHRVIALDLPGHGGSDKPEKDDAYGRQMAEDVVLLLDHLKIDKAHVVGYSLGGMITMKLLTLHPDRVLSATIGGMGWVQEGARNLGLRDRMPAREGEGALGYVIRNMPKLAVTEAELKAIRVPVKVVIGDQDGLKARTVAPLRTVRPDWPVVEIAGAGHINCIFKKQFADEIVKWVDQNRRK